jgi:hypothetical protein
LSHRLRINAGDCLIREATTFATSDLIVIDKILMSGEPRWNYDQAWLWQPSRNDLSARRLSIYQVQGGRAIEVFRQTALRAKIRRVVPGPSELLGADV